MFLLLVSRSDFDIGWGLRMPRKEAESVDWHLEDFSIGPFQSGLTRLGDSVRNILVVILLLRANDPTEE